MAPVLQPPLDPDHLHLDLVSPRRVVIVAGEGHARVECRLFDYLAINVDCRDAGSALWRGLPSAVNVMIMGPEIVVVTDNPPRRVHVWL